MSAMSGAATCSSAWEREIDEALMELERQVQLELERQVPIQSADFARRRTLHELEEAAPWSCKRPRLFWLSAAAPSSHRAQTDPADVRCQEPDVRRGSSSCAHELGKAVADSDSRVMLQIQSLSVKGGA